MIVEEQGIDFRTGVRFPSAPFFEKYVFAENNVNTYFFHLFNHIYYVANLMKNVRFYDKAQHEPQYEI